jgi:hypothetical protein
MKTKRFVVLFVLLVLILAACSTQNTEIENNDNQSAPSGDNAGQNNAEANTGDSPGSENQEVQNDGENSESADEPAPEESAAVSFDADVLPILRNRCLNCHGGDRVEGGLSVGSYAELMAGGESGAVVIPGDSAGSLLYELAASGEMPKRGANLTPVQLEALMQWIDQGALDN